MRLLLIFCLIYFSTSMSFAQERFSNSDGMKNEKSLSEVLKWSWSREEPKKEFIKTNENINLNSLKDREHYALWIGHSTFLINNGDLTILTDPIFSERASPLTFAGPKRLIKPVIKIKDLPKVDVITISHNHYDHLDVNSLRKIQKKFPNVKILVPKGDLKLLRNYNLNNGFEFLWWEAITLNNTKFIFTPAQHWSARGLRDRNKSLWGSWFIKTEEKNIFHAGDTGYSDDFIEIRNRLGPVDFAMIPIGAYDPQWFMSYSHVNPEEALNIAKDLDAKKSIGMHWGTFILTDEPVLEPRERLNKISNQNNINFYTVTPGNIIEMY
ncbi:MAG: MBL fold metallo-hydrolase [Pseudomonadota bacterium]|nr:MBL fold metallo-hydrolase [Pseudomonadota bacterium]